MDDRPSDDDLVARVLAGEDDAFAVLMARYAPLIHAVARRHPATGDAAIGHEDLVQEITVRAYRRLAAYTPGGHFGAWLGTVGANRCIDLHRRRRFVALALDQLPDRADPAPEPEDAALAREVGEGIVAALATLSDRQADAVWRCCGEGQTYQIAADAMGVPRSTIRMRLNAARVRLRGLLAGAR